MLPCFHAQVGSRTRFVPLHTVLVFRGRRRCTVNVGNGESDGRLQIWDDSSPPDRYRFCGTRDYPRLRPIRVVRLSGNKNHPNLSQGSSGSVSRQSCTVICRCIVQVHNVGTSFLLEPGNKSSAISAVYFCPPAAAHRGRTLAFRDGGPSRRHWAASSSSINVRPTYRVSYARKCPTETCVV